MGANNVTADDQIEILIPWLNGDEVDEEDVVRRFLGSFAGSREFGALAWPETTPFHYVDARRKLLEILHEAGGLGIPFHRLNLRFSVMTREGIDEDGNLVDNGAGYGFNVDGEIDDVLIYAFMRTLAGSQYLAHCPAPAPHDWTRACDRLFVSHGGRGRPREYCSTRCRVRMNRWKNSDYGGAPQWVK